MENLKMDSLKVWENYILPAGTIISESLNLIRKMEGVYINGQESSQIYMKESSWREKEMVVELSGGQMGAGMKDSLEMVFKVVMVHFIEKVDINNMKDLGTTECLMVKAPSSSKTDKNMKEHSKKINSMDKVSSTKMIQLSMESGKITSSQL